ncbi:MAG: DUF86 domain-containing protein [Candidatus Bathyarchaeia archaeon]
MKKRGRVYFLDILGAIEEIEEFTRSLTFDEFAKNKMVIRAVTMDFAVIGEAAKRVPSGIKRRYPKVPWRQMAGIRDKIIHGMRI